MKKASCHNQCPLSRYCMIEGSDRDDFPEECGQFYHLEDILADAREMEPVHRGGGDEDDWNTAGRY